MDGIVTGGDVAGAVGGEPELGPVVLVVVVPVVRVVVDGGLLEDGGTVMPPLFSTLPLHVGGRLAGGGGEVVIDVKVIDVTVEVGGFGAAGKCVNFPTCVGPSGYYAAHVHAALLVLASISVCRVLALF